MEKNKERKRYIFIIYIIINSIIPILSNSIKLKIKGIGLNKIFSSDTNFPVDFYPNLILINNINKEIINHTYYFDEDFNEVELIWNFTIGHSYYMFKECNKITEIDLSSFDSSLVTNTVGMFRDCESLTSIIFGNFDTRGVKQMTHMFCNCISLTSLDLSVFDTSKVTSIQYMFKGCYSLSFLNLKNFNTSSVKEMQYMFQDCKSLTSLDLSSFDTSLVSKMHYMFTNCTNLEFINLQNFDDSKVTKDTYINNIFDGIPDNIIICIDNSKNSKILNQLSTKSCYNISCSTEWKSIQKKIIKDQGTCITQCTNYEYGNFYCTADKTCPSEYSKLIPDLKKCVKNCSDDTTYIYEIDSICYKDPPSQSIAISTIYETESKEEEGNIDSSNINQNQKYTDIDYTFDNIIGTNKISYLYDESDESLYTTDNTNNISDSYDESGKKVDNNIGEGERFEIIYTSTLEQKNNINKNITTIDLGECEYILRQFYNISNDTLLYIKRIDANQYGYKIKKILYEVYNEFNSINLTKLNLSLCENKNFMISIPIIITENIDELNSSSGYYNDICYPATSQYNTDIILKDRRNEFIKKNKTLCQDDCFFAEYDHEIKKAKCKCKIKESSNLFDDLNINISKLYKNFADIKAMTNINFMICYKKLFTKEGLIYNIGNYIIISVIAFHFFCIFFFYMYQFIKIKNIIEDIIFGIKHFDLLKNKKEQKRSLTSKKNNSQRNKNIIKKPVRKNEKKRIKNEPIKNSNPLIKQKNKKNKKINSIIFTTNKKDKRITTKISTNNLINIKLKKNDTEEIINKTEKIMKLTKQEMNELPYKIALKIDKRTYCQYYISLLITKHNLISSFYNNDDYNPKIIKINLFFLNFTISYIVNALFFTDNTMHKIYEDEGTFDVVYQIPKIVYSSLISAALNKILKLLALSNESILNLKANKSKKDIISRGAILNRNIKIKFILYFIISFIFLIFFWYYISMFCVIYRNTQIYLIKDTLISFGISFISPFGIYLLPGIFRLLALSNPQSNRNCLYTFSKFLQII